MMSIFVCEEEDQLEQHKVEKIDDEDDCYGSSEDMTESQLNPGSSYVKVTIICVSSFSMNKMSSCLVSTREKRRAAPHKKQRKLYCFKALSTSSCCTPNSFQRLKICKVLQDILVHFRLLFYSNNA